MCDCQRMELFNGHAWYRALQARDPRFDGRLFVGVTSTGIYCRPICPARTPRFENCRFFVSAAAAASAGFRPCLRCRPEHAPGVAASRGTANTISRALAIIASGGLDDGEGVDGLAGRLGVGGRQLRRLFQQHLGTSPLVVAQMQRLLLARELIETTRLSMAEVALAAGFRSVRRFNEACHDLFGAPPQSLRRLHVRRSSGERSGAGGVTLRGPYQPPYDWLAMLQHLGARAIEGVEQVAGAAYARTVCVDGEVGTIHVRDEPHRRSLAVLVGLPSVRALPVVLARVRRLFDTRADITAIGAHLSQDPVLSRLVEARPGLRVPGAWDPFELAVRAILGQQVTVAAARTLAWRLVSRCGTALASPDSRQRATLTHVFPSPAQVAQADLRGLGMPVARTEALQALARAADADPGLFARGDAAAASALRRIRGIGEWTCDYIALRGLGDSDAFPSGDRALRNSMAPSGSAAPTSEALRQRAEPWRPWRAYAAQHLWAAAYTDTRTEERGRHD